MWTRLKRGVAKVLGRSRPTPSQKKTPEEQFEAYKRDHPDTTFAQFYAAHAIKAIRAGKAHSTLGLRLYDKNFEEKEDRHYFDIGRGAFKRYQRLCDIRPRHRVIDYGCGSLRVGIHFIEFLDAGNYLGLDVTRDFIDIGAAAIPELVERKDPRLLAIDGASLEKAAEFCADIVISNAVSYHVHPGEKDAYLGNLKALCTKPGARLLFNVKCSPALTRLRNRSWAYPLDFYIERLKPLRFVARHRYEAMKDSHAEGVSLEAGILEFRRD